jgi:hypothetical protein
MRLAIMLLVCVASTASYAQDAAPAPSSLRLVVELDEAIAEPARAAIRAALAIELNATLLDQPTTGVSTLSIARTADGQVQLSLHESRAPVTRTLPSSHDEQAAVRDIALMAANLVRDQTRDLLTDAPDTDRQGPAAPPTDTQPKVPKATRAVPDPEAPPDFAAKPVAQSPTIPDQARVQLLAVVAPMLALAVNRGGKQSNIGQGSWGLQGRFDLPIAPHLSLGAGCGIYAWERGSSESANLAIGPSSVMDAAAWLRAHLPIVGPIAELYLAAGAGPSLQNAISAPESTATPGIGLNAALLTGVSVRLVSDIGLVLELGSQYHLMHARQIADSKQLVVHALQLAAQLGVRWAFDDR